MSRITLSNLTKTFRAPGGEEVRALDAVDLEIGGGELVVLLGPSGCGKTTMLRCIAGLEQPTAGEIMIGETLMYTSLGKVNVQPDKRNLGMVFQSYALWPHKSVADNVAYPLRRRRVARSAISGRVTEALEKVDCAHLADRYPHELSGGQQQRISLARALVGAPRVLLFDEPLSNLDAGLRDRMRMEIRSLQQQMKYTALYVTHDQREAMALADRLVVMNDGKVLQVGTAESVYARPTSAFVADFLGAANLIPVTQRVSDHEVQTPVGRLRVRGQQCPGNSTSRVVVRQEAIQVANGHVDSEAFNVIEAPLVTSEFLGDHRLALFEVNGVQIRAKLAVANDLGVGERHRLVFHVESSLLVEN